MMFFLQKLFLYVMISAAAMEAGCASLPRIVTLHDPLSPSEHFTLAVAYEKKKEYPLALKEYENASKEGKFAGEALTNMANIYLGMEMRDEAEAHYLKAIQSAPAYGPPYNNLAWLYIQNSKNLDQAESLLHAGIKNDPARSAWFLDTLATLYEKQGDMNRSLETLQKAGEAGFSGDSAAEREFLIHLEKLYLALGREKDAKEVHEKADRFNNPGKEPAPNDR